jgi:hypothetical protein
MLPSAPTLRHVLVIGVDGVRFDLLATEVTPVIWGFGRDGFLGPVPARVADERVGRLLAAIRS